MTDGGRPTTRSRLALPGYLIGAALLTGAYLAFPASYRAALLVAGILPIGATILSFTINKITDRLPWLFVIAGLGLLTVVNATLFIRTQVGGDTGADGGLTQIFMIGGYLGLMAASVVVVMRHAPQDAGGVVDATLIGLGAAAPVWEFLLRPSLVEAGTPLSGQAVLLVQTLALLAILGSLVRISRTTGRAKPSLKYLFASLLFTVMGVVLAALTAGNPAGRPATYLGLCWIVGYLCLGAAALHPSAADFARPATWQRDGMSRVRLVRLGMFLVLIPVLGGVPQLFGHPPDGLLLSLGPLLTIPLVLTRIGQLIAQRARDQRSLAHQATHDELTGLANRRRLFALAAEATGRCGTGELPSLAVLYCDLDGFKPINDRFGHEAGDHVLKVVSGRLIASLGPDDVVGRIGGDEFLALCPGAGPREAAALRRRIESAVAEPVGWQDGVVHLGVTVGLAVGTGPGDVSADALVAAADRDMYARKRGRHPVARQTPRAA
jgi:diguanylate cyclase (GGDEF)-like protein